MSKAVQRISRYLEARKKMRKLDRAWIHWINQVDGSEADLRAEDIASLLQQRADLLEALKGSLKLLEEHTVTIEHEYSSYRSLLEIESDGDLPIEIVNARAAIAKAEAAV